MDDNRQPESYPKLKKFNNSVGSPNKDRATTSSMNSKSLKDGQNTQPGKFSLSVEEVKARAAAMIAKPMRPSFEEVKRRAVEMLNAKPEVVESKAKPRNSDPDLKQSTEIKSCNRAEWIKRKACELTMQNPVGAVRVRKDIFKPSNGNTESVPSAKEESITKSKKRLSGSETQEDEVMRKKQKHPKVDSDKEMTKTKCVTENSQSKKAKRSNPVSSSTTESRSTRDRSSPELEILSENLVKRPLVTYGPPLLEVDKAKNSKPSNESLVNAEPKGYIWPIKSQLPQPTNNNNNNSMKFLRGVKETQTSPKTTIPNAEGSSRGAVETQPSPKRKTSNAENNQHCEKETQSLSKKTISNAEESPSKKQSKISGYFSPTKANGSNAQESAQEMLVPNLPELEEANFPSAQTSSKMRKTTLANVEWKSTVENLTRFKEILINATKNQHYQTLINVEDRGVIDCFIDISESAKALLIQLSKVKHIWRRVSDIKHIEIDLELSYVIDELIRANFLKRDTELTDLREMLELMKVKEVGDLLKVYNLPNTKKKADNIEVLLKHCQQQSTIRGDMTSLVEKRVRLVLGECVKVNLATVDVLKRLCILESLPLCFKDNSLSDILYRANLLKQGTLVYPDYKISMQKHIYRDRESFLDFHQAYLLVKEMESEKVAKNYMAVAQLAKKAWNAFKDIFKSNKLISRVHDKSLPEYLRRYTAGHTLAYAMTCGIDALSKLKEFDSVVYILNDLLAQDLYCTRLRGDWYERKAIIYSKHMKCLKEVFETIFKGIDDPKVDMSVKIALATRAASFRTAKLVSKDMKEKLDAYANLAVVSEPPCTVIIGRVKSRGEGVVGQKMNFLLEDSSTGETLITSVESCAINHYVKNEGFCKGRHNEGSTIVSLFGILFWNEIYSQDIPDAFISRYQSEPLDLYGIEFFEKRRAKLERKMQEIEEWNSEESKAHFVRIWDICADKVCLVNTSAFENAEDAHGLFECMGAKAVNKICLKLMKDYRRSRSGFPDLVVWTPGEKNKYKFVEVKSPNDSLSNTQRVWIDFLMRNNIHVEVCKVNCVSEKYLGNINEPTPISFDYAAGPSSSS